LPLTAKADQVVVINFFACQHQEVVDRLDSLLREDDEKAFNNLFMAAPGECRIFHKGDRLIL